MGLQLLVLVKNGEEIEREAPVVLILQNHNCMKYILIRHLLVSSWPRCSIIGLEPGVS